MKPINVMIEPAIIVNTFLLELQIDVVSTRTPKIIDKYFGIPSKV